jgi:hypothetical protein
MDNPNVAATHGKAMPFSSPVPAAVSKSGHPYQKVETFDVAANTSQTPMSFEQQLTTSYELSNSEAVQGAKYTFGQQGSIAGQPPMAPHGALPSFEKLDMKAIATTPGPMGTDYQP